MIHRSLNRAQQRKQDDRLRRLLELVTAEPGVAVKDLDVKLRGVWAFPCQAVGALQTTGLNRLGRIGVVLREHRLWLEQDWEREQVRRQNCCGHRPVEA